MPRSTRNLDDTAWLEGHLLVIEIPRRRASHDGIELRGTVTMRREVGFCLHHEDSEAITVGVAVPIRPDQLSSGEPVDDVRGNRGGGGVPPQVLRPRTNGFEKRPSTRQSAVESGDRIHDADGELAARRLGE
jgi:hypothetical protein